MKNTRPVMKRVGAYLIDLLIVLIISSTISNIPFLNKNIDKYQSIYKEYEEKYNDYSDYIKLLDESYKDNEISEEEYTKLVENTTYNEKLITKYDDEKISKGEYKEIITNINEKFDITANDYVYLLNKVGVSNSIITIVCTILYFGVLQYFLKGQTIGKKLFKLKVISASEKKINIINYLLRSLIVNDVFLNTVSVVFLIFSTQKIYTSANEIIGTFISIIEAIIIFLVLTREDQRGIHDLLFNTKVVSEETSIEEPKKEIKNNKNSKEKTIDAKYKEISNKKDMN